MKELSRAKARLSPVLDDASRRALALALFRDVLAAATACPALDGVAVVSGDPDVLAHATDAGAEALVDAGGLNEALTAAGRTLAARSPNRLVMLAADLPFVDAAEIETVVRADDAVVIVASRDGGTNALALAPGTLPFRFGPESARRHEEAAQAAGLRWRRLDLPSLAFDVDTPEDLEELRRAVEAGRSVGARTLAALAGLVAESVRER